MDDFQVDARRVENPGQRLRKLERFGLISRGAYDERVSRVEYRLTRPGRRVYGIIGRLRELQDIWPGPRPRNE